jgi:Cu/Ag efflux pump CusA
VKSAFFSCSNLLFAARDHGLDEVFAVLEARITAPVEVEMLGIPDQVMLRSMATYGLTDITVDFAEGTDIYWARQQVAERLSSIWGDLPPDVDGGIATVEELAYFR